MLHYGPNSYFSLAAVGPRDRLRAPFPYKRKRQSRLRFLPGVESATPYVYRTGSVSINVSAGDGDKFRVRVELISGSVQPMTLSDRSVFNVNK